MTLIVCDSEIKAIKLANRLKAGTHKLIFIKSRNFKQICNEVAKFGIKLRIQDHHSIAFALKSNQKIAISDYNLVQEYTKFSFDESVNFTDEEQDIYL